MKYIAKIHYKSGYTKILVGGSKQSILTKINSINYPEEITHIEFEDTIRAVVVYCTPGSIIKYSTTLESDTLQNLLNNIQDKMEGKEIISIYFDTTTPI